VTTPRAFRHATLWIWIGIGLIAATVWYSLDPRPPSWIFAFGPQAIHALAYGMLTFWFGQLYGSLIRRLLIATAFALMGTALEAVQGEMGAGRRMHVDDLLANVLGIGLAVVCLQTPAGRLLLRFDAWLARGRG
jgi:hypothetical protein